MSELAWTKDDYLAAGDVPPERLSYSSGSTEGQLMTDDEVSQFLKDGQATIMILRDKASNQADRVEGVFWSDLAYLLAIGRIDEDVYNELTDPANYSF